MYYGRKRNAPADGGKTPEQAVARLTELCSRSERCEDDVRRLMTRWKIEPGAQDGIVEMLLRERYIDQERYVRAFVEDKLRFSGWGAYKIKAALRAKHIDAASVDAALEEFGDDEKEHDRLVAVLSEKLRHTSAEDSYRLKGKLLRFASSRGFGYEEAMRVIDELVE